MPPLDRFRRNLTQFTAVFLDGSITSVSLGHITVISLYVPLSNKSPTSKQKGSLPIGTERAFAVIQLIQFYTDII